MAGDIKLKAPDGKWALYYGIHRGTSMSRDSNMEEPIICDSRTDADKELAKLKTDYARMGYRIWFANLYDDKGGMTPLHADHFI